MSKCFPRRQLSDALGVRMGWVCMHCMVVFGCTLFYFQTLQNMSMWHIHFRRSNSDTSGSIEVVSRFHVICWSVVKALYPCHCIFISYAIPWLFIFLLQTWIIFYHLLELNIFTNCQLLSFLIYSIYVVVVTWTLIVIAYYLLFSI